MVERQEGPSEGSKGYGRITWEWTRSIIIAVVLFLGVRAFLVEAFKIPTSSMEGTLLVGDYLLVNKAVYGAEVTSRAAAEGYSSPFWNASRS